MGRPTKIRPVSPGPSRREFFKRSGGAAALVASAAALPLGAEAGHQPFQHGVASGDPLSDRVMLWTRVTPQNPKEDIHGFYVVATDPALTQVVRSGKFTTGVDVDYTVHVDAKGLQPGTTYYYRFQFKQKFSPIGRTRTLPVGQVDRLRMAVVSCSNFAAGYFNAYRCIAQRSDLDLVIHLGDYIYEYGTGQYGTVRPCEPSNEAVSLSDYRTRHAQYKRDPDLQAMQRQHPLVAIWDDHETANNAWQGGAENHQPASEGDWANRVAGALQAYYEWMPVRRQDPSNPRRNNRRVSVGNLVDLFMLEERLNARSEQVSQSNAAANFSQTGSYLDPARTLLGSEEEQWLIQGLRSSGARWRVIGQGVMFAQLKVKGATNAEGGGVFLNDDQWDGYQPARDRIFAALCGTDGGAAVRNAVILTGDIHSAWAADLTPDPNNPDVASGGYNPRSGAGSVAVEFVATSVTSAGIPDPDGTLTQLAKSQNPHFKHVDLLHHGYMLLDVTPQRLSTEFWSLATVESPDTTQTLSAVWQVKDGAAHLSAGSPSTPPAQSPAPAP